MKIFRGHSSVSCFLHHFFLCLSPRFSRRTLRREGPHGGAVPGQKTWLHRAWTVPSVGQRGRKGAGGWQQGLPSKMSFTGHCCKRVTDSLWQAPILNPFSREGQPRTSHRRKGEALSPWISLTRWQERSDTAHRVTRLQLPPLPLLQAFCSHRAQDHRAGGHGAAQQACVLHRESRTAAMEAPSSLHCKYINFRSLMLSSAFSWLDISAVALKTSVLLEAARTICPHSHPPDSWALRFGF